MWHTATICVLLCGDCVASWPPGSQRVQLLLDCVQVLGEVCLEVCEACEALLLGEALRTRSNEAVSWDSNLLALLNRCQESCMLAEGEAGGGQDGGSSPPPPPLSPLERQLLQLPPQGRGPPGVPVPQEATPEWFRSLLDKVRASLSLLVLGHQAGCLCPLGRSVLLLKSEDRSQSAALWDSPVSY